TSNRSNPRRRNTPTAMAAHTSTKASDSISSTGDPTSILFDIQVIRFTVPRRPQATVKNLAYDALSAADVLSEAKPSALKHENPCFARNDARWWYRVIDNDCPRAMARIGNSLRP